jgi:uncharacterized protein (DUF2062 family)
MAVVQDTILSFQKISQKNALVYRLHRVIDEYILSDLRILFQPDQTPAPLVIAVALGTILSFIPAPFLDSLLVGLIIARFKKINRSALIASRIVWNDLIVVPLYVPGFRFGMQLVEPFLVKEPTFTIKIIGFSLGLMFMTTLATILSAGTVFAFVSILNRWRSAPD